MAIKMIVSNGDYDNDEYLTRRIRGKHGTRGANDEGMAASRQTEV